MSFSQSSVLKCLSAVCTAMILGCGPSDGSKELLEGKENYNFSRLQTTNATSATKSVC